MGGIYGSSNEDRYFESLVDKEMDRRDWRGRRLRILSERRLRS